MIKAGLQISIAEVSDTCGPPYGTVERILSADLQLKKIALRWIPYLLKEKQINQRVKCSSQLLQMYLPNKSKRIRNVVIGAKS